MAVAALAFGIISIVLSLIPGLNIFGLVFGVIGIALGITARNRLRREGKPADFATGGMITSIIGTVFSFLFFLACAACVGGSGLMFDRMMRQMQEQGFDSQRIQEEMKRSMEKAMEQGRMQQQEQNRQDQSQQPRPEEKIKVKPNQI